MKTNPPEGTNCSPETELLNDNTPTETTMVDRTVYLLHYFKIKGPAAKLHAVPPEGQPVYEIFLESDVIFFKAGSMTYQLTSKPKPWQKDLRLTAGTIQILKNFESQKEAEKSQQKPVSEIRRMFFNSLTETAKPKEESRTKNEEAPIERELLHLMYQLAEELRRKQSKTRIESFNDLSGRKSHIVLFERNKTAGTLINNLLQRMNTGRINDENFHSRGGRLEFVLSKLCGAKPDARIFVKHYSNGHGAFNFPEHTGTILVVEQKK
jgi:hypothetical protein